MTKEHKSRDAEATKKAILDGAEHIFAQKGYAGTTIKNISEECGLSGPLILFHFQSKRELYREVKRHIMKRYEKTFRSRLLEAQKSDTILEELARAHFDFSRDNPNMIRIANWALLEGDGEPWEGDDDAHHLYYASIMEAQRRGNIRQDIPPVSVMAFINGAIHMWWEYHEHIEQISQAEGVAHVKDEDFFSQCLSMIFRGLQPIEEEA